VSFVYPAATTYLFIAEKFPHELFYWISALLFFLSAWFSASSVWTGCATLAFANAVKTAWVIGAMIGGLLGFLDLTVQISRAIPPRLPVARNGSDPILAPVFRIS